MITTIPSDKDEQILFKMIISQLSMRSVGRSKKDVGDVYTAFNYDENVEKGFTPSLSNRNDSHCAVT